MLVSTPPNKQMLVTPLFLIDFGQMVATKRGLSNIVSRGRGKLQIQGKNGGLCAKLFGSDRI